MFLIKKYKAELVLFRSGKWSVRWPAIMTSTGADGDVIEKILWAWQTRVALPLNGGLLCCVDVSRGLLLCNVMDELPVLRYTCRFRPIPITAR